MKLTISTVFLFLVTMTLLAAGQQATACQIKELKSTALVYPTLKPIEGRVVDDSGWPVVGAVVLQYGKPRDVDK